MKIRYSIFIIIPILLFFVNCGGESKPKTYTHTQAGFKITIPAGWNKASEDNEMFEFHSGNYKVAEVGGFDLPMASEDLFDLSDNEFILLLQQLTMDELEGYCGEAMIRNYKIKERGQIYWGGETAFRMKALGYSNQALDTMIVDMRTIIHKETSRMYMFVSQIEKDIYPETEKELELMKASFEIIQ